MRLSQNYRSAIFCVRHAPRKKQDICMVVLLCALSVSASFDVFAENVVAPLASRALDPAKTLQRVALGSCFKVQRNNNRVWDAISDYAPDVFIYAGDTLYPNKDDDSAGLPNLRAAYAALAKVDSFARLRDSTPVLSVWDDHDFGDNDGGGDFALKKESESLFESNWGVPDSDPRRHRPGVYFSRILGADGERLQVILLDTRFFRSPLTPSDKRGARGRERYIPATHNAQEMLGDEQWAWLQGELEKTADLRLIVSSVQVLADGHGWEGWKQLPAEREKLFGLLRQHDDVPVLLLSGDRHVAGFYERDIGLRAPLLEFTSSALNNTIGFPYRRLTMAEDGPSRLGELEGQANFGTLDIDWQAGAVELAIRDDRGAVLRSLSYAFR